MVTESTNHLASGAVPRAVYDLVSVIVPCFNRAHLVVETLESIAAQTYAPIEVVVVDDGSTDDSVGVVHHWAETRGRLCSHLVSVRCFQQSNAGPSAARNHGFRESTGEFIQFLDSDDVLEAEKLRIQVKTLANDPGLDFCVCDYLRVNATNTKILQSFELALYPHSADTFPARYPMNSVTPVYRRRIFETVGGYDESLRAGEDFEFNFRVMLKGKGLWIRQTLVRCRTHESPERIQAGGYARHFGSLALGILKMELAAIQEHALTRELQMSFAKKEMQYEQTMLRECNPDKAAFFRRRARTRVNLGHWYYLRFRALIRRLRKQGSTTRRKAKD